MDAYQLKTYLTDHFGILWSEAGGITTWAIQHGSATCHGYTIVHDVATNTFRFVEPTVGL